MTTIASKDLHNFAVTLLHKGGFTEAHAEDVAKVLVWADARGTASHGVLRIPRYVQMVEQGRVDPGAKLEKLSSDGAVTVLDAGNMPGATAMLGAMDESIGIAKRMGIGWCSVKNLSHAGAVGFYAMQAAQKGMVGIVMSASIPLMAYHGAKAAGLSTNPISIAVPKSGNPLLLDMSTSTVALGKITHAKDARQSIPEGWGTDENGTPTTDPEKVKTMTPLGGPKGSGLSLMIEILASILISNPVISESLKGGKSAMNGLTLAIDINRFCDPDTFAVQIEELVTTLKLLPKADGIDEILMPGERGYKLANTRMQEGIPLASGTVERLTELAKRYDIPVPSTFK